MDPTDIGLWRDFLSAARCVWRILIIASEYRHPKLMSCTSPSPELGQKVPRPAKFTELWKGKSLTITQDSFLGLSSTQLSSRAASWSRGEIHQRSSSAQSSGTCTLLGRLRPRPHQIAKRLSNAVAYHQQSFNERLAVQRNCRFLRTNEASRKHSSGTCDRARKNALRHKCHGLMMDCGEQSLDILKFVSSTPCPCAGATATVECTPRWPLGVVLTTLPALWNTLLGELSNTCSS